MNALNQTTTPKPGRNTGKSSGSFDIDKPVGRFRVRAGDLVIVNDPRIPRPFLAEVTGSYTLARVAHVQLAAPPGSPTPVPRQSTKARNIEKAWRLAGRSKTGKGGAR